MNEYKNDERTKNEEEKKMPSENPEMKDGDRKPTEKPTTPHSN